MHPSITDKIAAFINEIGIPCRPQAMSGEGFLPGIFIENGSILYDPERMKYPGDLLHEAGHLAILLPEDRAMAQNPDKMFGDLQMDGAELAAIAWSWAALVHLQLPPAILFHEHGYKGGADNLIGNFSNGKYIGAPMICYLGMADSDNSNAHDKICYPAMRHWLR